MKHLPSLKAFSMIFVNRFKKRVAKVPSPNEVLEVMREFASSAGFKDEVIDASNLWCNRNNKTGDVLVRVDGNQDVIGIEVKLDKGVRLELAIETQLPKRTQQTS